MIFMQGELIALGEMALEDREFHIEMRRRALGALNDAYESDDFDVVLTGIQQAQVYATLACSHLGATTEND